MELPQFCFYLLFLIIFFGAVLIHDACSAAASCPVGLIRGAVVQRPVRPYTVVSDWTMDRWFSVPAWHQTDFLPAPAIPSSTNQPVWDALQIIDHNIHIFLPRLPSMVTLALNSSLKFLRFVSLTTRSFLQLATILIHCPENGIHYSHLVLL